MELYKENPFVLFKDSVSSSYDRARKYTENLYNDLLSDAQFATILASRGGSNIEYIVNFTDQQLKDIESGRIKLNRENGKLYAQFRDANNKYSDKIDISKRKIGGKLDMVDMANALQMKAIQGQLDAITEEIESINENVLSVLEGQQSDRIALYFSGYSMYLEAKDVEDHNFKKLLLSQAIRALSDSNHQLSQVMSSDINYLIEGKYKNSFGKSLDKINEKINNINKSYCYIHQAFILKAAIYCDMGEITAMTKVLEEYANFIELTVAKNAAILAEADPKDSAKDDGIWKKRSKLLDNVDKLVQSLESREGVIYLDLIEEVQND